MFSLDMRMLHGGEKKASVYNFAYVFVLVYVEFNKCSGFTILNTQYTKETLHCGKLLHDSYT